MLWIEAYLCSHNLGVTKNIFFCLVSIDIFLFLLGFISSIPRIFVFT
jgi:hypothetical protein